MEDRRRIIDINKAVMHWCEEFVGLGKISFLQIQHDWEKRIIRNINPQKEEKKSFQDILNIYNKQKFYTRWWFQLIYPIRQLKRLAKIQDLLAILGTSELNNAQTSINAIYQEIETLEKNLKGIFEYWHRRVLKKLKNGLKEKIAEISKENPISQTSIVILNVSNKLEAQMRSEPSPKKMSVDIENEFPMTLSQEAKNLCLEIFDLNPEGQITWTMVREKYKKLVLECHPDKGKMIDGESFKKLKNAFELLKKIKDKNIKEIQSQKIDEEIEKLKKEISEHLQAFVKEMRKDTEEINKNTLEINERTKETEKRLEKIEGFLQQTSKFLEGSNIVSPDFFAKMQSLNNSNDQSQTVLQKL